VEDLRLALRRLSLRRQNNLSERRFFEEDRERRRGAGHGGLQESAATPSESIMSLGNLHLWASRGPYLPDKLQIVKPLEGEGAGPRKGAGRSRRAGEAGDGRARTEPQSRGREGKEEDEDEREAEGKTGTRETDVTLDGVTDGVFYFDLST